MGILAKVKEVYEVVIQFGIVFLECVGVMVLLASAVKALIRWIRREKNIQLDLAQGIALALEFKLGGEVLRTTIVREPQELLILGAIIVLRGALTFLIHWEIKNEESKMKK